jgi:hypothetical protein
MRTFVTIALAVVAGVHCGANAYSGEPNGSEEPAITEEPPAAAPVSGTKPSASNDDGDEDPRWAIKAEGLPPTVFTTTVRGDDGAYYMAGTFAGWLTVGRDTLKSKGENDVVLARIEADGRIAWVKSIGSRLQEKSPKVTYAEGKVRIMAETEGQVDCGSGEMGKWSSGMFFYCLFDPAGEALGGGTFPTGAP